MQGNIFTYFAAMFAGYLLVQVSLADSFLSSIDSAVDIIGIITVIVFAAVLIFKGVKQLIHKS
ncbi:hypothetical protein [Pseudalkalibacillus berkeleyi]|uniref:Uncharacterized protein n=1 Tax=Pseudalkalibacillus berkeleyi TaxID=1069813 RepID=A0ABS9H0H7_9BACL|nr:hypothetical protein [Pseudalkalibacillus berkeleyi]MCF6137445.1 hypothetical protein [Pseudalkalibacillus berkeleyi]